MQSGPGKLHSVKSTGSGSEYHQVKSNSPVYFPGDGSSSGEDADCGIPAAGPFGRRSSTQSCVSDLDSALIAISDAGKTSSSNRDRETMNNLSDQLQALSATNEILKREMQALLSREALLERSAAAARAEAANVTHLQFMVDQLSAAQELLQDQHLRVCDDRDKLSDQLHKAKAEGGVLTPSAQAKIAALQDSLESEREFAQQELIDLRTELSCQHTKNSAMVDQTSKLTTQVGNLTINLELVQAELAEATGETAERERLLEQLTEQVSSLEDQLARAEARKVATAESTLEVGQAELSAQQVELNRRDVAMQAERQAFLDDKAAFLSQRTTLLQERDAFLKEREALLSEKSSIQNEREGLLSARRTLDRESESLKQSQQELEATRQSLATDQQQQEDHTRASSRSLAAILEARHADLAANFDRLAEDNERLRGERVAAQESLRAAQRERDAAAEDAREALTQVVKVQAAAALAATERAEVATAADASAAESAELRAANIALSTQLEGLQKQLAASASQQQSASAAVQEDLESQLAAAEARATAADTEATEARCRVTELLAQLGSLTQLHATLQAQLSVQAASVEEVDMWRSKYLDERIERRRLHEELSTLKGNIRVLARVRPTLTPGAPGCMALPLPDVLSLTPPDRGQAGKRTPQDFEFDHVMPPEAANADVFDRLKPLVRSCLDGFNTCVFAYGQTGSGKTHTMVGAGEDRGVIVRALDYLFQLQGEEGTHRPMRVSIMEIYNESVRDLLAPREAIERLLAPLEVSGLGPRQLPVGMDRVPGAVWRTVSSVEEVLAAIREGHAARATAATSLNSCSSRSHMVMSVAVAAVEPGTPPTLMNLIDLAGSERVSKSEVQGQQMREAQGINKSLSALGDVIQALQKSSPHVPYRNSKLTQVLQDSLCGSAKVMLLCNVAPEESHHQESISSLTFAQRVASVELGAAVRVGAKPAGGGAAAVRRVSSSSGKSPLTPTPGGSASKQLSRSKTSVGTPVKASPGSAVRS